MFLINGRVKENADTAELGRPLQIMISSVYICTYQPYPQYKRSIETIGYS